MVFHQMAFTVVIIIVVIISIHYDCISAGCLLPQVTKNWSKCCRYKET